MINSFKNFGTLPKWLVNFESTYDRSTGGWKTRGKIDYASVELEVGRLWHSLVLLIAPKIVLETGTCLGYSTSCMASALEHLGGERIIYTIDPSPRQQIWAGSSLEKYIKLVESRSQDASDKTPRSIDMLVLDSDHHYDTVNEEIRIYEPRLKVGGLILMHDVLFFDGVGSALRQLILQNRFEYLILETPRHHHTNTKRSPGVAILKKKRQGPPIDFNPSFSGLH